MYSILKAVHQRRIIGSHLALAALLSGMALYLRSDFQHERQRLIDETGQMALHRSELISRAFGDTFLITDYVLRDVLGRIDPRHDLSYPTRDAAQARRLKTLLAEKAGTVTGLADLALLDENCLFVAVSHRDVEGRKSIQSFCEARRVAPGEALHFEYMPAERSHSRRPVLLMSRTLGLADGRLQGAAMAVIDLDIAQRWLEGVRTDSNAVMALLDREGTLLARNPPLPATRASDPALAARRAELAQRGHGVFQTAATEDGRLRVAGVSPVGRLPFVAAVGYDLETALRGWHYRRLQFMVGFLVLSGLSFLALRIYLITLAQREKLRLQASTDPLTGAANRRAFQRSGQAEIARAQRHGHALSLLMVDIDKFKLVNDSWGHPTGDRVIQALATTIQSLCRGHDLCGRLGGEEFAILLPQSDLAGAAAMAERLRVAVRGVTDVRSDGGQEVRFTISLGAATLHGQDDKLDALLQRADRALYQAKETGRNRVMLEQA